MAQDLSSPIEQIKDRLDIIEVIRGYVNLQKAGSNYKALCPFHHEKTPSFFVSPDRQIFKCFGCDAGGDVIGFVQQIEGIEFRDALRILADKAGVVLRREDPKLRSERGRLYEVCQLATKFFQKQLQSRVGQAVQEYLIKERGLRSESIRQFQLGYAPDGWRNLSDFLISQGYTVDEIVKAGLVIKKGRDAINRVSRQPGYYDRFRARIMFPLADTQGNIIGFTARLLPENLATRFAIKIPEDMGKYINTPETLIYHKSKVLYGLDKAKTEMRRQKQTLLVEGNTDVILCHQAGFKNAIACSGTSLTDQQLKIIGRYTRNLTLAFDMDAAGQMATRRSIALALEKGFDIKITDLPQDQDPAQLIVEDIETWQKNVAGAKRILQFYFDKTFARFDPQDLENKKQAAASLLPWIKKIPNQIEQSHWLQQLGQHLNIEEVVLRQEMAKTAIPKVETHSYASLQKTVSLTKLDSQKDNYVKLTNSLLGLLILRPQYLDQVKEKSFSKEILNQCLNEQDCQIISHLKKIDYKNGETYQNLKDKLTQDLADKLEKLAFEAECQYFSDEDFDCQSEIMFCCQQLKHYQLKEKLNNLNQQIKEAEMAKDQSRLKKLLKEFNKLSQQLAT